MVNIMKKQYELRYQVGAVIWDGQKEFLVLKRNPKRYKGWGFVKGGIEEGENHNEAIIREVCEETGISVEAQDVKPLKQTTAHYHQHNGYVAIVEWFLVTVAPEKLEEELELSQEEWLDSEIKFGPNVLDMLTWQTEHNVLKTALKVMDT